MADAVERTVEAIGAKMDALGLWKSLAPYNFAIRPRGTVFPYFCNVLFGDGQPVRTRFLMLEGWQTLHDFVRTRADSFYGFYSTPVEMPHYELVILDGFGPKLFRHDPLYLPAEANEAQRAFVAKLLWEAYGILLRLETEPQLLMRYAEEKSVFARVEREPGVWADEPLEIPDARAPVENVRFAKDDLRRAQDLPLKTDFALEVDFRLVPGLMTREARPRCVYALRGVDASTGEKLIDCGVSGMPEAGLRGLWESMPPHLLKELVRLGRIPGEIRLVSARAFRLIRPLCIELPFKLSLHDSLEKLEAAFA